MQQTFPEEPQVSGVAATGYLEPKREPATAKYDSTFAPYRLDTTSPSLDPQNDEEGAADLRSGDDFSASAGTAMDMDGSESANRESMRLDSPAQMGADFFSDFKSPREVHARAPGPAPQATAFQEASHGFVAPSVPQQQPSEQGDMALTQHAQQVPEGSQNSTPMTGAEAFDLSSFPSPTGRGSRGPGDSMQQMAYFQLGAPSRGSGGRMSRGSGFLSRGSGFWSRGSGQMMDIPASDEAFDFNAEDEPPQLKYFTREPQAALHRLSGSGKPPLWSGNMSDLLVTPSSARNSLTGGAPFGGGGAGNLFIPELAGALGARGSFNGGVSPLGLGFSTPVASPRVVVPASDTVAPSVGSMSMNFDPLYGART